MSDRSRTLARAALVALSIMGLSLLIAGVVVWLTGGFTTSVYGFRVRATDAFRPIVIGVALIVARVLSRKRLGLDTEILLLRSALRPPAIAIGLTVLITVVAFGTNYGVGGGADSFGYVSEADLWLAGDLTVEQDWLRGAPWPHVQLSTAPLGYRPATTGLAIVPVYAPGLPLLLALGKAMFGQCGFAAVIAAMAGLLVAVTYRIGRRLASPQVGAAAAWLIATCPVVLFMMASPMSDVPAGAMTAIAMLNCLNPSRTRAFLAGLSMALVVLIRPNLAPLVVLIGFWLLCLDGQSATWRARIERSAWFGAGAAPGAVVMALFNAALYGAATASGYGDLDRFFSASHILANVRNYSLWLFESQTPVVAFGLAALALPARWIAKTHRVTSVSLLLLMAAGVTIIYLPYMVFDRWWYLRFFLPAWPVLAIGTAWLLTDATGRTFGRPGIVLLLLMGGWGLYFANMNAAFQVGWGDLRYVSAAHAVREITPPESVILAMQHSGSVTYYSGRRSLRYDWIEPQRLEDGIRWLKERGHAVYILLDEGEIESFRARFRGRPHGELPPETLVFRQDVGTRVFLFDTRSHEGEMVRAVSTFLPSARRCCGPVSRAERR